MGRASDQETCHLPRKTVDARYLEVQGTLWNTSRHPYLDISVCKIEEKNNRTNMFHIWICNLTPEDSDTFKILWKRGEIAPKEQFLLFSTIFYFLLFGFCVNTGTRFSLWDKWLFKISKVEITRVDCSSAEKTLYILGNFKQKGAFEQAQNVRIDILHMSKVSFGPLLSIETFYCVQWFCLRT